MIWNSIFIMTVFDLVIMSFALLSLKMIFSYRKELRRLGNLLPLSLLILAACLLGFFYLADLFIMWGMPYFVEDSVAMAYMMALHLNWSWITNLIIAICIFTGLFQLIHKLLIQTKGLGELNKSLDDELNKRDQEVTELNYQASHDALTRLVNRREFEQRVNRLITAIQHEKGEHAMCFLDLDRFKIINDTCGHVAGDELLRQLGELLQKAVRNRDTVARLGGDEFGLLIEHCSLEQAYHVAEILLQTINEFRYYCEGKTFQIGVSIGLVLLTEDTSSFTELLKQADTACYLAKDQGRNRIRVYNPTDSKLAILH